MKTSKFDSDIVTIWDTLYDKLWTFSEPSVIADMVFVKCKCGGARSLQFGEFYELRAGVEYEYTIDEGNTVGVRYESCRRQPKVDIPYNTKCPRWRSLLEMVRIF
jgi:hypothetical protein